MPLILNNERDYGQLMVWHITETEQELSEKTRLSIEELERFSKIRIPEKRCQFLAVRAMAWEGFGKHIGYRKNAQPYFEDSSLHISISHTGDFAVLLVSSHACGVDIEGLNRSADHLLSRFSTEEELEKARRFFPENPAILIWSAKEALYKLIQRAGVEFRTELLIEEVLRNSINAYACERRTVVNYQVVENFVITEAYYAQNR